MIVLSIYCDLGVYLRFIFAKAVKCGCATDHRCHVTSPGVPRVLGGEIEVFVDALIQLDADERVAAFEAS